MNEEELKTFLRSQIDIENRIVERVEENTKDTRNLLIRELLRGIAYDSMKHANMLSSLIALIESKTPFISEAESREFLDGIREHIKLEQKAIETYSILINQVEDKRVKLIISYILEDEKRHHALLKKIKELIIHKQTLTEEDIFNLVWQYSVTHGSPGG